MNWTAVIKLKEASDNSISVCRDSLCTRKTHTCLLYLFQCGTLVEVYLTLWDSYCRSNLKHKVSCVGKVSCQDSSDLQTLTQIREQGYYLTPPHTETCKHSAARGPTHCHTHIHRCINDAVDVNEEEDTLLKAANDANYRDLTLMLLLEDISE